MQPSPISYRPSEHGESKKIYQTSTRVSVADIHHRTNDVTFDTIIQKRTSEPKFN